MTSFSFSFRIIFSFLILFGALSTSGYAETQRQFLLQWQSEHVRGSGYHAPYANFTVRDTTKNIVVEGQTDASGYFEFLLPPGKVDLGISHTFFFTATNHLGRSIYKSDGSEDSMSAFLPGGLVAEGQTAPDSQVLLKDSFGNVIKRVRADGDGYYVLTNAERDASVVFEDGSEVPFTPGEILTTSDFEGDPEHTSAPEIRDSPLNQDGEKNFLFRFLLGSVGVLFLFLLFFFLYKRHQRHMW